MNPYRLVPLAVSSLVILALFGVICWLAIQGDHDMRVAVVALVTGGTIGSAGASLNRSAPEPAPDPPKTGEAV